MRAWVVLAAGAAVYAGAVAWMAGQLPATGVPLHFAASGAPTRVGTRQEAVASAGAAGAVLLAVAVGALLLVTLLPVRALNVPHREYWTAPARRDRFRRMVAWDLALLLGGTLAALALLPVATVLAVRSDPVGLPAVLLVPAAAYALAVAGWLVHVLRYRYRPDRQREP